MNFKYLKITQELQTFLDGSQAIALSLPGNNKDHYNLPSSIISVVYL